MASTALILDLVALVKEQREVGLYWTEQIRNIYGVYIDSIKADDLDGTVQEILYKILANHGVSRMEIDSKMETFINELPYTYFNVAGRDNMNLSDGAKDAIASLCKDDNYMLGIGTPIIEKMAQNMLERVSIKEGTFKFAEYGGLNKDGNSILISAATDAKAIGADPDKEGIFVSSSPYMIESARAVRLKTIAITGGNDAKFATVEADEKIRSLRDLRKALPKIRF